jgi:hypothetical protein
MLEDIEKYIRDVVGFKVENYFNIFLNQGLLKSIERTLGDTRKVPKDLFLR